MLAANEIDKSRLAKADEDKKRDDKIKKKKSTLRKVGLLEPATSPTLGL